jgi:outer membrane protein assembly factor BamA
MRFWTISILVVFATTSYIDCQQASQSNKVSYEGQKVATVELVANPKISVESLRSLAQQKIDEPYVASKIESTISALRETGRFSDVQVDVKPDPGGLRVTFTLEPAFYFGVFDFPGATKRFSYTRLLQVVDIPNQTPFKQDVVSKAHENLLQFFVSAGYFQAEVQPERQF